MMPDMEIATINNLLFDLTDMVVDPTVWEALVFTTHALIPTVRPETIRWIVPMLLDMANWVDCGNEAVVAETMRLAAHNLLQHLN